jgi:hypothetical protein
MGSHIVKGTFQSDKYPTCPPGKVPLSVKDPTAQDLLWEYAQRRRSVDAEFSADLETALRSAGYAPKGIEPGDLTVLVGRPHQPPLVLGATVHDGQSAWYVAGFLGGVQLSGPGPCRGLMTVNRSAVVYGEGRWELENGWTHERVLGLLVAWGNTKGTLEDFLEAHYDVPADLAGRTADAYHAAPRTGFKEVSRGHVKHLTGIWVSEIDAMLKVLRA